MGNTESTSNSSSNLSTIHLSPGDDEEFHPAPLPLDEDGFITSFHVEEEEEILKFFEKHGVVVVSNILTDEQCQRSVDDLWLFLKEMFNRNIDQEKPETWESGWPMFSKMGIIGNERWLYP